MPDNIDKEGRIEIDGVAGRMLMGLDVHGNKRFLRCDEDGFLLVKVAIVDPEELEVNEDSDD
jgi:hypothetical protein